MIGDFAKETHSF